MKYLILNLLLLTSVSFANEAADIESNAQHVKQTQEMYKKREASASCFAQLGLVQGEKMSKEEKELFNECLIRKSLK